MLAENMVIGKAQGSPDAKRICYIDGDICHTISMDYKKRKEVPKPESLELLEDGLKAGTLEILSDEVYYKLLLADPTPEQEKKKDRRWEVIGPMWESEEVRAQFFDKRKRRAVYQMIAEGLDLGADLTGARTIYTGFLRNGMSANALYDMDLIRTRGKQTGGNKCGRKTGNTFVVTPEEEKRIVDFYWRNQALKPGKLYNAYLEKYYSKAVTVNGIKVKKLLPPKNRPTKKQFTDRIRPYRNKALEKAARVSAREASNQRINNKTARDDIKGPGSLYLIDLTYLKINIVSEYNREFIISHPALYIMQDVFTGAVVSYSLDLQKESLETTRSTLLNLTSFDLSTARRISIPKEEEWFAGGLPKRILGDNGKIKSQNIIDFVGYLKATRVSFTKAYSPRDKGMIERLNGLIKEYLDEYNLPWTDTVDSAKRGRRNPKLKACLTLSELDDILKAIFYDFNHNCRLTYGLPEQVIEDRVAPTPVNLWKWATDHDLDETYFLKEDEIETLDILLHPFVEGKTRVANEYGVNVSGLKYKWRDSWAENYWEAHLGEKVEIHYSPMNATYTYARFRDETILKLELRHEYSAYRGLPWEEVEMIKKQIRNLSGEAAAESEEIRQNIKAQVKALIKKAGDMRPESDESDTARLSHVRENTSWENKINRMLGTSPLFADEPETYMSEDTADYPGADYGDGDVDEFLSLFDSYE